MNFSRLFALLSRRRSAPPPKTAAPRWLGPALQTAAGGLAGLGIDQLDRRVLDESGIQVSPLGREGMTISNAILGATVGNPVLRRSVYGHWIDHEGRRLFAGMDPKKFVTGVTGKALLPGAVLLADRGVHVLGNVDQASQSVADSAKVMEAAATKGKLTADNLYDTSKSVKSLAQNPASMMDSLRGAGDSLSHATEQVNALVSAGARHLPQIETAGGAGAGALAGYALGNALQPVAAPNDAKALTRHRRINLLASLLGAGAGAYGAHRLGADPVTPKTASINGHVVGYARHFAGCAERLLG